MPKRVAEFLRSVIPADPFQSLFLAGVVCLVVAHGLRWWEFDLTRYIIWALEKCGLAWNVVWPRPNAETEVDPVTADQAGALLLFGAQIKDPRLDAEGATLEGRQ